MDVTGVKHRVLLVGSPNVGKSMIFFHLTGKYATVSNYPGTTVEIARGKIPELDAEVIDTPGMYSLMSITEEERVAKKMLFEGDAVIVHVVDAKNIDRMLPFTLQLIDAGFNVILVLNAMDEAERAGLVIDIEKLRKRLGIPVIPTIAIKKKGIRELKEELTKTLKEPKSSETNAPTDASNLPVTPEGEEHGKWILNSSLEKSIQRISSVLSGEHSVSKRVLALLLLAGDPDVESMLEPHELDMAKKELEELRVRYGQSPAYRIAMEYEKLAEKILEGIVSQREVRRNIADRLGELTLNPIFAIPMSLLTLYALYLFAGVIGAQILVDAIEGWFEQNINTALNAWLEANVPNYWLRELVGGDYGIITLAFRYAIAIVLPVVPSFFLIFSIIEDSGYLPRMAFLLDGLFKKVGLSGRAVIPLVLGFGCGTMATIVTRVLESRRERMIATLMLAVAIPCSAQLGVIMAIAPDFRAIMLWAFFVFGVLLTVGFLASQFMPGEKPVFFMEIPPLRMPSARNVFMKTFTRLEWYFKEVLPIFVIASILIWVGRITGIFQLLISVLSVPAMAIGLPAESAVVFLYGFFRRDYGAAGLYDIVGQGIMDYRQIVVAMISLTLFVPCVAQFGVMIRERGIPFAVLTFTISALVAFGVGYLASIILSAMGV
jgi:ferrous iron transport protein B